MGPPDARPRTAPEEFDAVESESDDTFRTKADQVAQALQFGEMGLGADDSAVIELLDGAATYGEALLLARAAAGAYAVPPPEVPPELAAAAAVSSAGDFYFEGWSVAIPAAVAEHLRMLRGIRDMQVEDLDEDAWAAYEIEAGAALAGLRGHLALQLDFDATFSNLGDVTQAEDGSLWRRGAGAAGDGGPSDEPGFGSPGGGPISRRELDATPEFGTDSEIGAVAGRQPREIVRNGDGAPRPIEAFTGRLHPQGQIIYSDQRVLRSSWNGFDLSSSAWGPKMLLMNLNGNTNVTNGFVDVFCSGVKISPRVVITAGHCLYEDGSWNDVRRIVPGADGVATRMSLNSDPSPHGSTISQWRRVRGPWYDHEWTNHDFGLMVLYDESAFRCWWWHGWEGNISGLTQDTIYLYGYPGESLDCSGAGSPVPTGQCWASMYGNGGTVISEGGYRFYYSIDTQVGQSGSGVYKFNGSSRIVYGVHRGPVGCCENDASRLNANNTDLIQNAHADYPASSCN